MLLHGKGPSPSGALLLPEGPCSAILNMTLKVDNDSGLSRSFPLRMVDSVFLKLPVQEVGPGQASGHGCGRGLDGERY